MSELRDAVQVTDSWQATCDNCGWHTSFVADRLTVRDWARLHRETCPLRLAHEGAQGES